MKKTIGVFILIVSLLGVAGNAAALEMPTVNDVASMYDFTAHSYIVVDQANGNVLLQKDSDSPWVPASLTKLVTALVVLDTKPKISKVVTMAANDQVQGACTSGGGCITTKAGVKYTLDGLFHAAIIASANNAAYALSRSTGLSETDFVNRMNAKAKSLGALNTHFNETTGMDPNNMTTAYDYSKIVAAAFNNTYLQKIAATQQYTLYSTNNKKYVHVLKNTDKLLADSDVKIIGGKTGFLYESKNNFGTLLQDRFGNSFVVVVFGSQNGSTEFSEAKRLTELGGLALSFGGLQGAVLGTTTQVSLN